MNKLTITESKRNKVFHKRGTINTIIIKKTSSKNTVILVS